MARREVQPVTIFPDKNYDKYWDPGIQDWISKHAKQIQRALLGTAFELTDEGFGIVVARFSLSGSGEAVWNHFYLITESSGYFVYDKIRPKAYLVNFII